MDAVFYQILAKYEIVEILDDSVTRHYTDRDYKRYTRQDYWRLSENMLSISEAAVTSANVGLTKKEKSILSLKTRTLNKVVSKIVEQSYKGRKEMNFDNPLLIASSVVDKSITKSEETEKLACLIILTTLLDNRRAR